MNIFYNVNKGMLRFQGVSWLSRYRRRGGYLRLAGWRLIVLGYTGTQCFPFWDNLMWKKYLETKYSASSVAGVLRVSSLIRSTPMKSPVPLKEVTSL